MNTKQRFRHFIGNSVFEDRSYMATHSALYDAQPTLPRSVNNFLNMIPHDYQNSVLNWIMSEGLRQAAIARREFAKQLKDQKGIDIHQDQLFSPLSYESNPSLGAIKDKIEQSWFDHQFEPRYIKINIY